MRTISLNIVVNSHLSDSLIEVTFNPELAKDRIRFVKILINRYPNLDQRISEETLNKIWEEEIGF
jgi:hypothetical protein